MQYMYTRYLINLLTFEKFIENEGIDLFECGKNIKKISEGNFLLIHFTYLFISNHLKNSCFYRRNCDI